ncbi:MAG: hypothetical protein AB7L41_03970 [Flavobacteriaceae bacterium]
MRLLAAALSACALGAAAFLVVPQGREAGALLAEAGAPEAVARYRLAGMETEDFTRVAETALVAGDADLAASVAELAASQGKPLPAALQDRISAAREAEGERTAADAWAGFLSGDAPNEAALAGAIAADLTGYGDFRDLYRQAEAHIAGKEVDMVTVGLAAVGITLTAATVASLGTASPAKAGVSTLKAARRAGRLSPALAGQVTRIAGNAVDAGALRSVGTAAAGLDLKAMRAAAGRVLRPGPARQLRGLAGDVGTLGRNTGYRGTLQALDSAGSATDLRRAARVSQSFGKRTRGVLAMFGGAALTFGSVALSVTGWLISALVWCAATIWFVARLGARTLDRIVPGGRRNARAA